MLLWLCAVLGDFRYEESIVLGSDSTLRDDVGVLSTYLSER